MHRYLAVGCVGFGFGFRLRRRRRHLKQFGVVTAFFPCGALLGSARLSPFQRTKGKTDSLARWLARSMYVALVEFRLPAEAPGGEKGREEGKLPFGPLLIRLTAEDLPSPLLLPAACHFLHPCRLLLHPVRHC